MATASDKAKDVIEQGADIADQTITTVASKASKATRRAGDAAEDAVDDGRDALENALACSKDAIRSNPLTAVVVAAAIAYLWGRLKR